MTSEKTESAATRQPPAGPVDRERQLKSADDKIPAMIGYWDRSLHNRFTNLAYAQWFGVDPAKMPGMHIRDVIGDERYGVNLPYIEAALAGQEQQFERAIRAADGRLSWHGLVQYIPDFVAGQVQGVYIIVTDISRLKQVEVELSETEKRFRQMFENNASILLLIEPESGAIVDANAAAAGFYGYSIEQLRSMRIDEINTLPPSEVAAERARAVQQARNYFIFPHRLASGESRIVEVRSTPITVDAKTLLFSIVSDVTRIKDTEYALREAQKLGGVGSFRHDIANDRWTSSEVMDDIFGIDANYLHTVDGWAQRVHPDDRDEMLAYWQTTTALKTRFDKDYRIVRASDGAIRWVHGLGAIVCNERGEPAQFIGSVQDITERKLKDKRLLEKLAAIRLREQALSQISQGVLITDADRRTTYVNDEFVRITGYSREEMLGKPCSILQGPDSQPEVVLQMRAALDAKQPFHGEILNYRKDGTPFWNDLSISPVVDEAGDVTQFVGVQRDVTERKQTLEDLKLFKQCINHANDVIVITEAEPFELPVPRILFVNDAYERTTGYTREEAIGGTQRMLQGPKTDPATIKRMGQALRKWKPVREEVLNYTKNGREFWSEIDIVPMANETGFYTHWISVQRDISERKSAEEAQRIASIAFETQQGMFICDAAKVILRVNNAFTEITGYSADEAVGQTPSLLKSDRHDACFYAEMWECIERSGAWEGEIWNRRKSGTLYPEHLNISSVTNNAGVLTHYVGAFSDLTSYKAAEEQINDLAYTDLLTGLPNRRKLVIRLQQAITAGEDHQHQNALLMLDLDNLKSLNDAIGRVQGDEVLQRLAKRLSAVVRDGDTVARLGSDEFVVLLDHLNQDPQKALKQVQTVANKIFEALNKPYQLADSQVSCSASIGITFFGEHYEDPLEPLRRAELAMYQAKSAGRNRLCFYDPQMQAVVDARVTLEAALREAIQNRQFMLYYQAQVSDNQGIVGAEALLRWLDPQRGMVSPAEFIPLAEETGLILPIGAWVLETACQQLALWAGKPELQHLSIAVNVSARQFRESNFVAQVLAALERSGANAQRLKLELTESVLIADAEDVIMKMNALKARGVGFAIDDFGTGYSSLSYLKRLPLERLKIDQSFVRNILMDADDAAIARAVIAMATSMGLGVIAEGVETQAQHDFLASIGCHNYQGYLFSRPLPVEEFEALVTQ